MFFHSIVCVMGEHNGQYILHLCKRPWHLTKTLNFLCCIFKFLFCWLNLEVSGVYRTSFHFLFFEVNMGLFTVALKLPLSKDFNSRLIQKTTFSMLPLSFLSQNSVDWYYYHLILGPGYNTALLQQFCLSQLDTCQPTGLNTARKSICYSATPRKTASLE